MAYCNSAHRTDRHPGDNIPAKGTAWEKEHLRISSGAWKNNRISDTRGLLGFYTLINDNLINKRG